MDEILTTEQWTDLQLKLKDKYPQLTDSDLHFDKASEKDMLRMVGYKLRKTKREMKNIISRI